MRVQEPDCGGQIVRATVWRRRRQGGHILVAREINLGPVVATEINHAFENPASPQPTTRHATAVRLGPGVLVHVGYVSARPAYQEGVHVLGDRLLHVAQLVMSGLSSKSGGVRE